MTYLIADSGATKTEWRFVSGSESKIIFTEGLNPYYHTKQSIANVISEKLIPKLDDKTVDNIYFYGAGCDGSEKHQMLKLALVSAFPHSYIEIEDDLLAAARACFFDKEGIVCILGTGSNSCLYDGQKVIEHIPSLAFILGDEGSAGYFGKKLINAYFRNELPASLKKQLETSYNMSLSHIMKELYEGNQRSRFIASYSTFLGEHADDSFVEDMLYEGFHNFLTRIVKKYTNAISHEIRFVGSVSCAHHDLIRKILQEEGLRCGIFIQKPLERLVEFHIP